MSLDSKQKRGSAIDMSLPHRQWLAVPDGTLASTDRVSLLKLCSAIAPAAAAVVAYVRSHRYSLTSRRRVYVVTE